MAKVQKLEAVICHQCYQSSHQLTDKYDQDKPIDGTMVTLREPYKSYGWETHPEDPGVFEGDIQCAFCEAPLAPGNVVVTETVYIDENGVDVDTQEDEPEPPVPKKTAAEEPAPSTKSAGKRRKKKSKKNS